jgi:hypothetical protein
LEYILPECLDDGLISGGTRQYRISCEHVRIDYWISVGFKKRGDGGLPGCYTTCEADNCGLFKSELSSFVCSRSAGQGRHGRTEHRGRSEFQKRESDASVGISARHESAPGGAEFIQ